MTNKARTPRSTAFTLSATLGLCTLGLGSLAGCKSTVDDPTLDKNVRAALSADSSINQQPVQVAIADGTVTLSGSVSDNTARSVAAHDAASVKGVKEVVNNLLVGTASASVSAPPAPQVTPQPVAEPRPSVATPPTTKGTPATRVLATKSTAKPQPGVPFSPAPSPAPAPAPLAEAAPPPPAPVIRSITLHVPDGETLPIRVTQTLDSATAQPGQTFSGVLARDVVEDGHTVLPAGAAVSGRVIDVKEASHFKGSSLLSVELTSIRRHGELIPVHTDPYTVEGKARGTNTAEKVGGGAAVGALLGGLLGGGKGAAIGAGVGGGAGAGVQGATRGQQVQIPSESVVRFRLTSGFTVRTTDRDLSRQDSSDSSGLQSR